jgi:hypothetical protein
LAGFSAKPQAAAGQREVSRLLPEQAVKMERETPWKSDMVPGKRWKKSAPLFNAASRFC